MGHARCILSLFLLACHSGAPAPVSVSSGRLASVGCYVLSWTGAHPAFPDTIALLSDSSAKAQETMHERGARQVALTSAQLAKYGWWTYYWVPIDSDSVRVEETDGFNGTVLLARLTADSLVGTASVFTDVVGALPKREFLFVARRARCLGL